MAQKEQKNVKNHRRVPKQARALAKYHQVLDACSRVLASQGYAKATMTEIALESDLPYATIYQYFENKQDVFIAWFERMSEGLFVQLASTKELHQDFSIEEYVELLIKNTLVFVSASKVSLNQLFYAMPHLLTSQIIATIEKKTIKLTHVMFRDQIEESELHDADYSVKMLTKIIIGYLTQRILDADSEMDIEKDSEELSLIINLYLNKKMGH